MAQDETGKLTHLGADGAANMVDVGGKDDTVREAVAEGFVTMTRETLETILAGNAKKGDVISAARIAGIMAAKRTAELIPMCHPLNISHVQVDFIPEEAQHRIHIEARVRTTDATGVEMEALTAVSMAALTIYDMCKAVDRGIKIENIRLVQKSGGKSGTIELE